MIYEGLLLPSYLFFYASFSPYVFVWQLSLEVFYKVFLSFLFFMFHVSALDCFEIYFIDFAIIIVPFSPLYSLQPCTPPPTSNLLLLSSCPWIIHISSLASPFPVLSLSTSLSILYLSFVLLIPCTFSPVLPLPPPHL